MNYIKLLIKSFLTGIGVTAISLALKNIIPEITPAEKVFAGIIGIILLTLGVHFE